MSCPPVEFIYLIALQFCFFLNNFFYDFDHAPIEVGPK